MMRQAWAKLRAIVMRDAIDDQLREELDAHLQMEVDANVDRGMTPTRALESARRHLGNRTVIQEASREAWMFYWLETLLQDVRYAVRTQRRSPGFALTAVSVIALGIGATSAAFTLLDYVLLRPLPFPRPAELVVLYQTDLARGVARVEASPPNFIDWRAMNKSFSSMGAYAGPGSITLSGQGEPTRVGIAAINAGVLGTLGLRPQVGRGFTPDDDRDGAPDVVLLSNSLAVTLFGSASSAVGRTVTLDNRQRTVVGVMPSGFAFPTRDAVLWTPLPFSRLGLERTNHILSVIARLRSGVSAKEARADMAVIAGQLERAYQKENAGVGVSVIDMRDVMSPQSRILVVAVFGAAFCLLLIACANLASLLLARAMARRQEMAVRVAIGAGRGRLVRQLLTESVVLALMGGALGAMLAMIAAPWLSRFVPSALPVSGRPAMDVRVWGFAALLAFGTCLAFGVGPSLRSWRQADPQALRSRSAGAPADRVRAVLVLAEVAGMVTLLVAAGLLVKALWRVQAVDPGFRPEGVLTLQTALPMPKYSSAARRREFYAHVLNEARALPSVTSVAYTTGLPLVFGAGIFPVTVPGLSEASAPRASIRFVTPEFFTTLRIPLGRGRYVRDQDDAAAPFVTVISESLAQQLWPGQDPIGRHVTVFRSDRMVVGVVGEIAVRGLERVSEPQMYFSPEQLGPFSTFYAPKDLVIRASGDPMTLAPALRRIIHEIDPGQPVSNTRLLDEIVASETASRRDQLHVLGSFAAIALFLAAVGIHGLLSFTVSARTQEIGVRVALGAPRRSILGMFLRQGLALGAAGIAVAVPLAYAAARSMTALLFGVQPSDPIIYGSAALLAMMMTVAGTLRPAVRAAIIDPAVTLRAE